MCSYRICVRYLQFERKSGRNNRFNKPGFLMRFGVTEKALLSKPNSRFVWMAKMKCGEHAFDIALTARTPAHNTKQWRTQTFIFHQQLWTEKTNKQTDKQPTFWIYLFSSKGDVPSNFCWRNFNRIFVS